MVGHSRIQALAAALVLQEPDAAVVEREPVSAPFHGEIVGHFDDSHEAIALMFRTPKGPFAVDRREDNGYIEYSFSCGLLLPRKLPRKTKKALGKGVRGGRVTAGDRRRVLGITWAVVPATGRGK